MPEAGYIQIPAKHARAGIKDAVRISDARMSGTAYGTVILHVAPDAAFGGTLGLVRNGDRIKLSVTQRSLDLLVDDQELARRKSGKAVQRRPASRGYQRLYDAHIWQANEGCDFDFLQAST